MELLQPGDGTQLRWLLNFPHLISNGLIAAHRTINKNAAFMEVTATSAMPLNLEQNEEKETKPASRYCLGNDTCSNENKHLFFGRGGQHLVKVPEAGFFQSHLILVPVVSTEHALEKMLELTGMFL